MKQLLTITALGLCLASALTFAQQQRPPAAVEVAEAQIRDIAPTVWVPGTVISRQDSNIAAEISGNLLWVAEVGDQVTQGQTLARLNDRVWQLQLENDQANVARLQVSLDFLERQVVRSERLAQTNSTSKSESERLTMERDTTRQQLQAAKVALARTQYDLERTHIKAPFDGILVARNHQPGEHIGVGETLVRLTNIENLEIRAQAPLGTLRYLSPGAEVAIKSQQATRTSQVRSLVPVGDERSRMLELRIAADANWIIGEAVRVELPNGERQASLTVPRDALVLREHQIYVFKVGTDDKAERIAVQTGDGYGSRIAITGNLSAGDLVIVRGAERLQEGQTVNIIKQHAATEGLASNS
ncbi:efflux RND transporter periplasmic adaptor subunit [Simiduia aestuariiviva]|uniref:RND family efflux transporter MFP subunit n=1 Tax=Simiduia aestuariiviva TaxID=1510459 RepID=A0A839UQ63_9GAMM|nr:efflux RND transporter periplasmic adaptor subunit [Simiduia aestuariiviva]MBB3169923.1 RND family efflux transporter MFP subunit [Simiduia aestuariiviva]